MINKENSLLVIVSPPFYFKKMKGKASDILSNVSI